MTKLDAVGGDPQFGGCGEKDAVVQVSHEEDTFEITVRSRQQDKIAEFQGQAFEKVTIHCSQSIEYQTHQQSSAPNGNMPCRAADAGVEMYCRHFVNAENVTLSVAQGKIIRAMIDTSADSAPLWSIYGVSRIVTKDISQEHWHGSISFQSTGLPSPPLHITGAILRSITLNVHWISKDSNSLIVKLGHPGNVSNTTAISTTAPPHSEDMALTSAVAAVLRRLGREYPFIFAQKEKIQRFLKITRYNSELVDALCRVYDRATSLKERQSMKESLERIQIQFPGVPPSDTQLLLTYALEGVAYNLIKKTNREKRAKKEGANIETSLLGKACDPERPRKQSEDDHYQHCNNDEHYAEIQRRYSKGKEETLTLIDITVEDGLDELDSDLPGTSEDSAFPESYLSDFCSSSSEEEEDNARDEDAIRDNSLSDIIFV